MWSAVTAAAGDPTPCYRCKHAACHHDGSVYILGGRNGCLPLRDFWKLDLEHQKWNNISKITNQIPWLQEHSMVSWRQKIYVFGGETGLSSNDEVPLWIYDIDTGLWMKSKYSSNGPIGRRGHSANVLNDSMYIFGGYQDLKGSCDQLWKFNFDTEDWILCRYSPGKEKPSARHNHSAVLEETSLWIYGGMTNLKENADLWKLNLETLSWRLVKSRHGPGVLHSHTACKVGNFMILFGGQRNNEFVSELWKFYFDTENWEHLLPFGIRPSCRSLAAMCCIETTEIHDGCCKNLNSTQFANVENTACDQSLPVTKRTRNEGPECIASEPGKSPRFSKIISFKHCHDKERKGNGQPSPFLKRQSLYIRKMRAKICKSYATLINENSHENIFRPTQSKVSTLRMIKSKSTNIFEKIWKNKTLNAPSRVTANIPQNVYSVTHFSDLPSQINSPEPDEPEFEDDYYDDLCDTTKRFHLDDMTSFRKSLWLLNLDEESPKDFGEADSISTTSFFTNPAYLQRSNTIISFENPNYMSSIQCECLEDENKTICKDLNCFNPTSTDDGVFFESVQMNALNRDVDYCKFSNSRTLRQNFLHCRGVQKSYYYNIASIYVFGGKEANQTNCFQRPLSVWKFILPFSMN